jgi:hypothetical protein
MILLLFCVALGVLLAQRFKAFVLAPASLLAAVLAIAAGDSGVFWTNVGIAVLAAAAVQTGYFLALGAPALRTLTQSMSSHTAGR